MGGHQPPESPDLAESVNSDRVESVETRPAKAARVDPKGWRILPLPRWRRRETAMLFSSEDREVEISIMRMPASVDVDSVKGLVVYIADSDWVPGGQVHAERIDESTRQVFAHVSKEYDDLCDRLFADDPVFSYRSGDDLKP